MTKHNPYRTRAYKAKRRQVAKGQSYCWRCGAMATQVDHIPPLKFFSDKRDWEGQLLPACAKCNHGWQAAKHFGKRKSKKQDWSNPKWQ